MLVIFSNTLLIYSRQYEQPSDSLASVSPALHAGVCSVGSNFLSIPVLKHKLTVTEFFYIMAKNLNYWNVIFKVVLART